MKSTSKPKRVYRPLKPHEVGAIAGRSYGSHDGLIRRLIATIDQGQVQEKCAFCKYRRPEVKWIGWPNVEPVTRTATDWLLLAMEAYDQFELQRIEDNLREKGKWWLWESLDAPAVAENTNTSTSAIGGSAEVGSLKARSSTHPTNAESINSSKRSIS